ncbi:MAG: hypothetical protein QNJ90_13825 [Planctomycetota bacterium]|nr:hypothetical protein [Planctomycetota bacterium]
MTRRPDSHPQDDAPQEDAPLLDLLHGELDADARRSLEERIAADPALAAQLDAWKRLAALEREAHVPEAAEADAGRLAAWIRSTVAAEETARTRVTFEAPRQRGWARILAWSVGLHVVVLGVLAFMMGGSEPTREGERSARVALEGEREWEEAVVDPADTALAFRYERIRWQELGEVGDRLALGEAESLAEELRPDLDSIEDDQPTLGAGLSHPVGVVVAMSRRTNDYLKRRRLDLLGFNAGGTLRAVDRGLRYLGHKQRPDGSFPGTDERDAVEQTALTLLAFLGDGHTSRGRKERDAVVQRGVAWLRGRLIERDAGGTARLRSDAVTSSIATVALCEDYMLSFGELSTKAAQRRAEEIALLSERASARLATVQGDRRTWALWALDATARSGVVTVSPADRRSFETWVAGAAELEADTESGATANAMATLSQGTALLLSERGADKPRFMRWSRTHAEQLVALLDPTGRAREGDTALILLALQVGYRTY